MNNWSIGLTSEGLHGRRQRGAEESRGPPGFSYMVQILQIEA